MIHIFKFLLPFAFPLAFFCSFAELADAGNRKKANIINKTTNIIAFSAAVISFIALAALLMRDLFGWIEFNVSYGFNAFFFLLAALIILLSFTYGNIVSRIKEEERAAEEERRRKIELGQQLIRVLRERELRLYWQNISRNMRSIF